MDDSQIAAMKSASIEAMEPADLAEYIRDQVRALTHSALFGRGLLVERTDAQLAEVTGHAAELLAALVFLRQRLFPQPPE